MIYVLSIVLSSPDSMNILLFWTLIYLFLCCVYIQQFRPEVVFLSLLYVSFCICTTESCLCNSVIPVSSLTHEKS